MITSEGKKIERFIWGLTSPIQGNVIAADPETFDSAKRLAKKLYDHNKKKGEKSVETEVKKENDSKKGKNNKRKGHKAPNRPRSSKQWQLMLRPLKFHPHHMLQPQLLQVLLGLIPVIFLSATSAVSITMENAERCSPPVAIGRGTRRSTA